MTKTAPVGAGDTWTWTAIDADSKLVMSWLVGGRDASYARDFIEDVYSRLANRVQITSDGHNSYLNAIRDVFGIDVDYARLVKVYGQAPEAFKGATAPRRSSRARSPD
jgi:transposase-like protein